MKKILILPHIGEPEGKAMSDIINQSKLTLEPLTREQEEILYLEEILIFTAGANTILNAIQNLGYIIPPEKMDMIMEEFSSCKKQVFSK